ncbi:ribokinase [Paraburkholderia sp. D1E]|uniref:ribokinase n=1 Tax=Paraburkholderia sp. D1E TaxID=3461398 RepID=UPI0040463227
MINFESDVHSPPSPQVIVLGSLNLDLVLHVRRMPEAGETLASDEGAIHCGGKGANQAVACARLGTTVAMVGAVGQDAAGQTLLDALEQEGIQTNSVARVSDTSSGVAVVAISPDGDNRIMLSAGANAAVTAESVLAADELVELASLLVCQLEVPREAVLAGLQQARKHGLVTVLNAAPASSDVLPGAMLEMVDYLIVNESEAASIAGIEVVDTPSAFAAARHLRNAGGNVVLVTLGSAGVVVSTSDREFHVPAVKANVVDTTAAGDTFVGALAAGLVERRTLDDVIGFAVAAAAVTVSRAGAQASIPFRWEVAGAGNIHTD